MFSLSSGWRSVLLRPGGNVAPSVGAGNYAEAAASARLVLTVGDRARHAQVKSAAAFSQSITHWPCSTAAHPLLILRRRRPT